jgi:DNA-3-methyladenine glycosylase
MSTPLASRQKVQPSATGVSGQRTPLPRAFFARDTQLVARELLGKLLVRRWRGSDLVGRITDVESYVGPDDLACHASKGCTPRTKVMFGRAGFAYVYLVYGMHELFNLVTEAEGFPAAVLVRSLEPVAGISAMERARGTNKLQQLTTGPGRLTQAMRITRKLNHIDCCTSETLFVADDGHLVEETQIQTGPRIGVDYAGEWAQRPWRYYLRDSKFVSRT